MKMRRKHLVGIGILMLIGLVVPGFAQTGKRETKIYQVGGLANSYWKTAGVYNSKFNGKVISAIANTTITGQFASGRNPEYTKEETAAGTKIVTKRRILNRKTKAPVADETVTVLLAPSKITVTTSAKMLENVEFNRYSSALFATNLSYLNTSKLNGYGMEAILPDGKNNKTAMIPEKFKKDSFRLYAGVYSMVRFAGENDSIVYSASSNALIWVSAAYNNTIEIYSALDPKNPDRRPIVLKKGQTYEWSSSVQFINN